ncbi:aldo/keto reductase [Labilibacter marinus]|uniref:aldo/keto reductase n=1 Tax=Labilibacter marinus TaxID=1477105 RepID=UPI000829C8E4|nr:aldo/keto reductase [Labilibacter marinus]
MSKHNNSRRAFFQKSAAATLGLSLAPSLLGCDNTKAATAPVVATPEWRNKQSDMQYRMLGKSGLMVSEIVLGTFPFNDPKDIPIMEAAVERGINYLDTASAYSQGEVEKVVGQYISQPGVREKVFVSTKLSGYYGYIGKVANDIFKGLPQDKKNALQKKAQDMIAERCVKRPGYHMNFFNGQENQFDKTYLRYVIMQEYGYTKEHKTKMKEHARKLLNEGLQRLQTDYVDVLHCPHGVAMPEMLEDEVLREILAEFKEKGLVKNAAVSFHNDVTANLQKAVEVGYYDLAMFAYNIANHAALDSTVYKAKEAGLGLIAMKVGRLFVMQDQPTWRLDKLNTTIPDEDLSKFAKAYMWALQNPNLSCCVSQMETVDKIEDNLAVIGRKYDVKSV